MTALTNSPHRRRFTDGMLDNERILQELHIAPGQVAVDAGCGNGYMAMLFSQAVGPSGHVFALDLHIDVFLTTFPSHIPANVQPVQCDMTERTPLADASADLVYTATVVHSLRRDALPGFVGEISRILRPGGVLAVVEFARHETAFGPPLWQRYAPEDLQRVFPLRPTGTVPVAEHFYLQMFGKDA